jgi:hypothetical protein
MGMESIGSPEKGKELHIERWVIPGNVLSLIKNKEKGGFLGSKDINPEDFVRSVEGALKRLAADGHTIQSVSGFSTETSPAGSGAVDGFFVVVEPKS